MQAMKQSERIGVKGPDDTLGGAECARRRHINAEGANDRALYYLLRPVRDPKILDGQERAMVEWLQINGRMV